MRHLYPICLSHPVFKNKRISILKYLSALIHLIFSPSFLKKGLICSVLFFSACTMPLRTGYDRKIGDYKPLPQSQASDVSESSAEVTEEEKPPENKKEENLSSITETTPSSIKEPSDEDVSSSSFEEFIKPWIGTRYKFGGSSRSGTDCSGYIMQVYKSKLNIALPHNAAGMFKMGSAVKAGDLKEGDLVFFGNVWGINHVGIYLSKNRFTHASSSQGVTITPMEMDYWKSRYKGARRFINE